MTITEQLDNKTVLIWGYGREGKSTEQFLMTHCKCRKIDVYEGSYEELPIDSYDIVIKSPGISHLEYNGKITSQTQLFLSQFSDRTIGVTGTKGKSTTVSLLYEVLSKCLDTPVMLVGNIGYPCFDFVDDIAEDTVIVFELSCHQLCNLTVSPHISVFLNLFEEHLDYYHSFKNYFEAKKNIALHQREDDFVFIGENVPHFPVKSKLMTVGKNETEFSLKIPGEHNQVNANFVFQIAAGLYGIDEGRIREAMEGFEGLSHRLEYVCTKNGVRFYDDSISTIPEAAVQAVKSIENVQSVLIGGMDRGIDYSVLVDFIKEREDVIFICMYETGDRIYRECMEGDKAAEEDSAVDEDGAAEENGDIEENGRKPYRNCIFCGDLTEAVAKAAEITNEGKACVLSPAAPSYKYFKNFEERGEVFKNLIKELPIRNC